MLKRFTLWKIVVSSAAVTCLLLLTVAFRPSTTVAVGPTLSAVESAYAPFDSIKTDLADYLWPTSARPKITSSFAEFRSSHFHAGIDIGTNNRIGADVYAARDGYIARVEVSPYGYGRFLVLRHPDGFYTTYGHLSAFNEKLERTVHAEQLKQGKFSIEMKFQPGDFPVRKGDVVAFSGESGSGSAHLHFEIRDENFNPVNPLLFPNMRRYTDTQPPVIRRLAVTPMNENSFVDYDFAQKVYRARARNTSSYTIPEVIRVTGSLGFSIDAADRVNNTGYRSSVYSFDFQVDGTTIFSSERDRFPEGETRQVGVDFDWALWKEKKGRFQKLYVDEGNTLPFYNRRNQLDGVVALKNLTEGLHKFKIIASDYSGNSSELTGMFVLNHPPTVEIPKGPAETLTAFIPNSNNVAAVEIGTRTYASKIWHVQEYSAHSLTFREDTLDVPAVPKGADIVRIVAKNIWGTHSFPVFHFVRRPSSSGTAELSTEVDGSYMKVWVASRAPFTAVPSLQVQQGNVITSVPLRAIDLNRYTGVYRLSDTFDGTSYVKAFCEVAGRREESFDSFSMNTVAPQYEKRVQSDDENFSVSFEPGAVFTSLHPVIEKVSPTRYNIEPHDVLLRGPIHATLRNTDEREPDDKLSMYVKNGGGWRFLGARYDARTRTFNAHGTYSLGSFALLRDVQKPAISRWRPSSFNMKGRPLFSFSVRDNLSGIDDDQINVFLNGERVIPEYDPEKKVVYYIPLDPLPRGHYTVAVEVKDRVGNAAHLTKTLSVYR